MPIADVDGAGDGHGQKGCFGVADAAQHGAEHVVGHDEGRADAADADIGAGGGEGLRGGVDQLRQHRAAGGDDGSEHRGDDGKQHNGRADAPAGAFAVPRAHRIAHIHGHAHAQSGDDHGDHVQQLTARGHGGLLRRAGELAHDQKVGRAVGGLQQQGQQHGKGEGQQRFENIPLGQGYIFHGDAPPLRAKNRPDKKTGMSPFSYPAHNIPDCLPWDKAVSV